MLNVLNIFKFILFYLNHFVIYIWYFLLDLVSLKHLYFYFILISVLIWVVLIL